MDEAQVTLGSRYLFITPMLKGVQVMKYRKYGIVELMDNKLAGVAVSAAPAA